MALALGIVLLLVLIIIGVPAGFSFGATTIFLVAALGYDTSFFFTTMYASLNSVALLAIPLFIMSGGIMEKGKIGDKLVGFIECFVGRLRGALMIAATVTCAIFGAICGSGAATLSCIGSIMAPKMRDNNYPMGKAAAILCCAAPIGMLIPPSSIQILYAFVGQLSVLACFLATLVPGIILTILISVVGFFMCRKEKDIVYQPKREKKEWLRHTGRQTGSAVPALVMPVIVLGGIYGGFMTTQEAAAIAVVYSIPIGMFVYRGLTFKNLNEILRETATTTGVIMMMLAFIMVLSRIFVMEQLPDKILAGMMAVTENKYLILLMINLFMVLIGMMMDDVSGTLICTPILIPLALRLGMSPYQMAAILGVNLGMGNITPPTAPFLYLASRICKVEVRDMLKPALTIIGFAYVPTLILVTYVPQISLWLPNLIMGLNA